ncbi:erythrocyte membrane protein 1, PfEMP1, putative [Plasmodium reichenowi]|uniref:Erythrocyte membrane protein 1, PfEMP1, putative n=1 Tax=Plasmodium reichenowi TaxID=5854 RepID=A0A2P9DT83_PLARE|nr:erythrocyte membrane protein 1, PfEMP1, putative [Plasmodium reichenowi]
MKKWIINDIYATRAPKYKTLIEVVLEPSENAQRIYLKNNISVNTPMNTQPNTLYFDNPEEKSFIMSIHDRDLYTGEEISYNINMSTNTNNDIPISSKNDVYSEEWENETHSDNIPSDNNIHSDNIRSDTTPSSNKIYDIYYDVNDDNNNNNNNQPSVDDIPMDHNKVDVDVPKKVHVGNEKSLIIYPMDRWNNNFLYRMYGII